MAPRLRAAAARPQRPAGTHEFTVELRDSAGAKTTVRYSLVVAAGGAGPGPGPASGNTSLVNAPSPRGFHTAVWTGSEMIVRGGAASPADTYLDTGAILTP